MGNLLHPVFDIMPPRDVLGCWTTLYQPRTEPLAGWLDCSPYGHHLATSQNGSSRTWVKVAPEDGLNLSEPDGTADLAITTGHPAQLQEFTCCAWVRPKEGAFGYTRYIAHRGATYWSLFYYAGIITARFDVNRSSGVAGVAGRWDFAAITVANGEGSLWVNGARRYSQSYSLSPSTNNLRFGGYTANYMHVGEAVYCKPLTDAQIRYLYESTRHRFGV